MNIFVFLLWTAWVFDQCRSEKVVLKRLTKQSCAKNPCKNNGKCIPGKYACSCANGWMGRYCHRHCRDIYKSCGRWLEEGKCAIKNTLTNFFDTNCAVSCGQCTPNSSQEMSEIPVPPSLEPLLFMTGNWRSLAGKGYRYPSDMYYNQYEENLNIIPAEVPMFGAPSFNYTSICKSGNDTRIMTGFITVRLYSDPVEIAILSSGNEGINLVELGTLENDTAIFNMTYVQVHPDMDSSILPLGGSRRFRLRGQYLEMTVAKLFPGKQVIQYKKMFKKLKSYPI